MHKMRTIAINDPVAWCRLIFLSVTRLRRAGAAERIEVLFWVETRPQKYDVLDGDLDTPRRWGGTEDPMQPMQNYFGHLLESTDWHGGTK